MVDKIKLHLLLWYNFLLFLSLSFAEKESLRNATMKEWFSFSKQTSSKGNGDLWQLSGTKVKMDTGDEDFETWMFTEPVSKNSPFSSEALFYLELNAKITQCVKKDDCFIETHVFQNDGQLGVYQTVDKPFIKKYINDNFKKANSFSENETFARFPIEYSGKKFIFAIKAAGMHAEIYRMNLFHYYCEKTVLNGLFLPKTISPVNHTTQVMVNCTRFSTMLTNDSDSKAFCHSNGSWSISNDTRCFCLAGFEMLPSGCKSCPNGFYKTSLSNTLCSECPQGSVSNEARTECPCISNTYRLTQKRNETDAPCYTLPSSVNNLLAKSLKQAGQVLINWSKVPIKDGRLNQTTKYDVKCFHCTVSQHNCTGRCPNNIQYIPGQNDLLQSSVRITGLRPGDIYSFEVISKNDVNKGVPEVLWKSKFVTHKLRQVSRAVFALTFTHYMIMGCVGFILVLSILVVLLCLLRKKRKVKTDHHDYGISLPPMDRKLYIDPSNYEDPDSALETFAREVDPSSLNLDCIIGGGEFGDVYRGSLVLDDGSIIQIAAKTLKNTDAKSRRDFFLEASAMGQFQDPNVIRLEGIITKVDPQMILTEFMSNGSLDHYLKKNDEKLSTIELITMARGIASGMKYLASIDFVHRDLAARNILVNDAMVCKVADFGLSRELETTDSSMGEYFTTGGKIPVRWTAPEAIKFRKFSSASDVWSYGILLWEIMTFGQRPYWGWSNFQVMDRVEDGFRLPPPMHCPMVVHQLMLLCWSTVRSERPSFEKIVEITNEWIEDPRIMVDNKLQKEQRISMMIETSISIEKWLQDIKLSGYVQHFTQAGYESLSDLSGLLDNDLKDLGITLIGHRNKILRNIRKIPVMKTTR